MQAQQSIKIQIIRKTADVVYSRVQIIKFNDEFCHELFNQSKLK